MSWNRKYRPRKTSELHLITVRQYFSSLLSSPNIPQAFLFTGPKGTGKTSAARILAAILNDPANKDVVTARLFEKTTSKKNLAEPDSSSPDIDNIFSGSSYTVQEMDAASNRGIDDIRALKERVQLPPIQGLVSVFILDEVHMLTTEAFNALLKLLEEPPSHVIFVLATTELHKVPETIVSRCQVIQFIKATPAELMHSLEHIVKQEKLSLPPDALAFIAQQAGGSFRDAIKLLEQVHQLQLSSVEDIESALGVGYHEVIQSLISAVLKKNSQKVVQIFQELRSTGAQEVGLHKDLVTVLYSQLLIGLELETGTLTVPVEAARFLLQELSSSDLSTANVVPFLKLELKLLEIIARAQKKSPTSTPPHSSQSDPERSPSKKEAKTKKDISALSTYLAAKEQQRDPAPSPLASQDHTQEQESEHLSGDGERLYHQWQEFVSDVARTNFSLATLLKSAKPVAGETGQLTLSVFYKFHQEQLQQPKFTEQLNALISPQYGGPVKINCVLTTQPVEAELTEPTVSTQLEKLAADALL